MSPEVVFWVWFLAQFAALVDENDAEDGHQPQALEKCSNPLLGGQDLHHPNWQKLHFAEGVGLECGHRHMANERKDQDIDV